MRLTALLLALWPALSLAGSGYSPPPAASGVDGDGSGITDPAAFRTELGLGTASTMDAGSSAGQVVLLDGSARLPAVDGSLLTNLPGGGSIGGTAGGTDNRVIRADGTGDAVQGSALTCDDSGNLSGVGNITLSGTVDGVDVSGIPAYAQSSDAEIAALAATTSGADALPYFTGSGTASTTTLTSAARDLLNDTTAAAMRATLGAPAAADVQVFTADGTWTEPAGATVILTINIGGGGGGGSGRVGATSSARFGGGGGGGGGFTYLMLPASLTGPTEAVVVGQGGTGGAAITATSGNGNDGTSGTASSFGSWAYAGGGTLGEGGTNSAAANGTGGVAMWSGTNGTDGGTQNGATATSSPIAAGGGAGGGGITSGNVQGNGGVGGAGSLAKVLNGLTGGVAGAAGSDPGGNGTSATAGAPYGGGGGGGGGCAATGTAAGNGGAGGLYGGGGGGGGAALGTTIDSGAGGDGADGIVVVVSW